MKSLKTMHDEERVLRQVASASGRASVLLLCFLFALPACSDVPSFDRSKAKAITAEKRKAYDLIFFNEMTSWNQNTNRHITEQEAIHQELLAADPRRYSRERNAELRSFAEDGYLPAYVVLRVYRRSPTEAVKDHEAIEMLIKSAESGDISSMCMLSYLPLTIMFGSDAKRYIEIGERYLAVGAERGHGACLAARGVLQFQKIFSADYKTVLAKKYNPEKGFPDLIEAARQGYYSAHRMMYFLREEDLREREYAIRNPLELDRVLCWGRLAQQHTNWAGFDVLLSTMRGVLQPRIEPRYLPQLDLYDPSKVPITRKVATPEKCIALEQQGDSK